MKKNKWIVPVAIIGVLVLWAIFSYNGLVSSRANVRTAWANVESAYQRRVDLVNNLVKTVQGSADFERTTYLEVVEARNKATKINIDPANATQADIDRFVQAQANLKGSYDRLLVTVENYPDLKSSENFKELQSQLEGTENRINVARDRYNTAAGSYEVKTESFPGNIWAGLFGFDKMPRFKAEEGSEKAPDVNFNFDKK